MALRRYLDAYQFVYGCCNIINRVHELIRDEGVWMEHTERGGLFHAENAEIRRKTSRMKFLRISAVSA